MSWHGYYFSSGLVGVMYGMFVFMPFYGFPLIATMAISKRATSPVSQMILAGTSLFYGIWFACFVYYSRYMVAPDAQGGLMILFVGIYALPGLLPLWLAACVIEWRHRKANKP